MAVLIDTNMLLAFAFARDANHALARRTLQTLEQGTPIVLTPVLAELFYMTAVRISYERAIQVFASTCVGFPIQPMIEADFVRMQQIMTQYQDAEFDFADTAIMPVAERLNITRVCTFDRRDFSIFRPAHCPYLELLP